MPGLVLRVRAAGPAGPVGRRERRDRSRSRRGDAAVEQPDRSDGAGRRGGAVRAGDGQMVQPPERLWLSDTGSGFARYLFPYGDNPSGGPVCIYARATALGANRIRQHGTAGGWTGRGGGRLGRPLPPDDDAPLPLVQLLADACEDPL